jgi:multidrug efflux pump subunit AcrA (membrane-fusion protein)
MVAGIVDGQTQRRQVKLGRQINDQVEILAGLQLGDKILLSENHVK